jgi:NADH-quinone oxidoreductase subunit G
MVEIPDAGNGRAMPKPQASCTIAVMDGMVVKTQLTSPVAEKAQRGMMEFLLINHPLDCPICDKSGECLLQDYTYSWRGGLSRFLGLQSKVVKPTKDVGPGIRIWGNRCVTCTRCVRFLNEVPGTGELTVVNRGDHSIIDAFPGVPVDNPMSLNIVDICPVGALISKDFLFQARVWYTQRTRTVCASCSRGCNVTVTSLDNDIKRLQPRLNAEVNGHWMCDEGRLNYRYVRCDRRLVQGRGTAGEIVREIRSLQSRHGPDSVAALCSSANTCEELHLFKKLADRLGLAVGFLTRTEGERWTAKSGFTIEADKTSNRAYLVRLWGEEKVALGADPIVSGLMDGKIRGLFVLNAIPDLRYPAPLVDGARRCEFVAVVDLLQTPLSELAHVVVPGRSAFEKEGAVVNFQGRVQRLRPAVRAPEGCRVEIELLQEMLRELQERREVSAAEAVFKEAVGSSYAAVGELGMKSA